MPSTHRDLSENVILSDRSPLSTILVLPQPHAVIVPLDDLIHEASENAQHALAENTKRAYDRDWKHFITWCDDHQLESLPAAPSTVVLYLADLGRTHRMTTLTRRLTSISQGHEHAGYRSPTIDPMVREQVKGLRRRKGTAKTQKAPTLTNELKQMVTSLPKKTLRGKLERALLLVGFGGAFRRSELVALNYEDLKFSGGRLIITIRRSKTDQEGEGHKLGIARGSHEDTCPVRSLQKWLDAAGIDNGPVFRSVNNAGVVSAERLSDKAVARAVKRAAERVGLDPADYAGHSLRAGLATSAILAGASEAATMKQTRHKSERVFRMYVRDADLFRDNVSAAVGL